jgi:hypothetical protein
VGRAVASFLYVKKDKNVLRCLLHNIYSLCVGFHPPNSLGIAREVKTGA